MRRWLIALAALAAGGFNADAKEPPPKIITQPDWVARPAGGDLEEAYPKIALILGIEGFAAVSCTVDSFGRLQACQAATETPTELGFGTAAVGLTPLFQMRPMTVDGRPADGGKITIPITFRLPQQAEQAQPVDPRIIDQHALALARRYVDAAGFMNAFEAEFLRRSNEIEFLESDGLSPEVRGDAAAAMRTALAAHRDGMRDAVARAAANTFTVAELDAMIRQAEGPAAALYRQDADRQAIFQMLRRHSWSRSQAGAHDAFCRNRDCDPAAVMKTQVDATLQDPAWVEAPAQTLIDAARPPPAYQLALAGAARLRCNVSFRATPDKCAIIAEAPAGLGFGAAALKLAAHYRLDPRLMAQGAEGESLAMVVAFQAPAEGTAFEPPAARSAKAMDLARKIIGFDPGMERAGAERMITSAREHPPEGVDAAVYADALAALGNAGVEAAAWVAEGSAQTLTMLYSDAELASAAAFAVSPLGRAVQGKQRSAELAFAAEAQILAERVTRDARKAFCSKHPCEIVRPASTKAR